MFVVGSVIIMAIFRKCGVLDLLRINYNSYNIFFPNLIYIVILDIWLKYKKLSFRLSMVLLFESVHSGPPNSSHQLSYCLIRSFLSHQVLVDEADVYLSASR